MQLYSHLFFDCDGVILDSNHIKTKSFYEIGLKFGEINAKKLINFHTSNGGISRYVKLKYFTEEILGVCDEEIYNQLVIDYRNLVRKYLLKCSIDDGILKIHNYLPKIKKAIISGSDQSELNWLFKKRKINKIFDLGIFGSPKNKEEIFEEIYADFTGKEKCLFFGDSKYDYEVSKEFEMDFIFVNNWTEFKDWKIFVKNNKIKTINNLSEFNYIDY